MADTFAPIREALRKTGKHIAVAKVIATDPGTLTADVKIETEDVLREAIPLRIFNNAGGLGMAFIPKVGSEVLVAFMDGKESRPVIVKVQEWEMYVMRKGPPDLPAFELVIDSQNQMFLRRGENFSLAVEGDDRINLQSGSNYQIEIKGDGNVNLTTAKDVNVNCTNAKIAASGNIDLGEGGSGVITNGCMPVCMVTNAPIPHSMTVKAKL